MRQQVDPHRVPPEAVHERVKVVLARGRLGGRRERAEGRDEGLGLVEVAEGVVDRGPELVEEG